MKRGALYSEHNPTWAHLCGAGGGLVATTVGHQSLFSYGKSAHRGGMVGFISAQRERVSRFKGTRLKADIEVSHGV